MTKKFQLSSIALILGGIVLSGCAPKQAWSPELAEAQKAYQKASSDPLVNSLAVTELNQAKEQLQEAENAADYFKSRDEIAHPATLSHLKSLEAKQTARALKTKEELKLAQAVFKEQSNALLIAAATPAPPVKNEISQSESSSDDSAAAIKELSSQLEALSQQIAQLKLNSVPEAPAQLLSRQLTPEQLAPEPLQELLQEQEPLIPEQPTPELPVVSFTETTTVIELDTNQDEPAPVLAAAKPAPVSDSLDNNELYNSNATELQTTPSTVIYNARLREELRAMNARPSSKGLALVLGERYFQSGSAELWNGRAGRHLDNIAAVMVENPGLLIDVEAHTDNQGSAEAKDTLTSNRATAIKSALVIRGVDAGRINTTGYADSSPIADNNTQLGRLQNRRVEIVFPNIEGI